MPKKESAILLGMALPRVFRVDFEKDSARDYLSWVEMLVNVVVRLVPRVLTAAMIATEMPAAIRPYSMAVAPLSFFRKLRISRLTEILPLIMVVRAKVSLLRLSGE